MPRESAWLLDYQKNIYSQSGEDGIISKILETLPETDKWCVEFGAWDGIYLCNTRNLIEFKGYSSVQVEASKERFLDLEKTYTGQSNIYLVNEFVGFKEDDNLDNILQNTPIPKNFDFLSIDVDGNDYHIWKVVKRYRPKVVCIEFNPTIPNGVDFRQDANPSLNQGCSVSAVVKLAKEKGYELVCVTNCNAIFVDAQYFPAFEITDNSIETLRLDLDQVTYLFIGFDGKVFLSGRQKLPWHGISIEPSDVQVLPWFLQKYSGNYNYLEKVFFGIFLLFRDPKFLFRALGKIAQNKH
jgi:Methyltransferase FkbM domain